MIHILPISIKRLSKFSKIIQLVGGRARMQTYMVWIAYHQSLKWDYDHGFSCPSPPLDHDLWGQEINLFFFSLNAQDQDNVWQIVEAQQFYTTCERNTGGRKGVCNHVPLGLKCISYSPCYLDYVGNALLSELSGGWGHVHTPTHTGLSIK